MASSTKKTLKLSVGMRYPVFVGSGAVILSTDMTAQDVHFQLILHATAVASQMTGPEVIDPEPKHAVVFDRKTKEFRTNYTYPRPSITVEECLESIKHIKALPYPTHIKDTTKQRDIILNYDFSNLSVDEDSLGRILKDSRLLFALELCVQKPLHTDTVALNKYIGNLKKLLRCKVWLKIPHPDPFVDNTYLQHLTRPDAIVLGHGLPAVKEELEVFDATTPTMESGSHLFRRSHATVLALQQHIRAPLIVAGGIHHSSQIDMLLKTTNVSGVQLTSTIVKDWMNLVSLHAALKRLAR